MFFIIATSLLLHLSICSTGDPCPTKTALAPCTCTYLSLENLASKESEKEKIATTSMPTSILESRSEREISLKRPVLSSVNNSFYTVVECKVSKSLSALEDTVSTALDRKLVDTLMVANVPPRKERTLSRLPSGWLKKIRVRQFEVTNSKLAGDFIWYGNPFEGQERSLLWFAATNCFLSGSLTFDTIGTVNTKGLNTLPRIEGVDFSNNFLTTILNLAFRYPPANLSTVIFSHNSINHIEAAAFQYIPLLKQIDLSHNLLESLVRSFFAAPARHLQLINLSWNSLSVLPADFFTNMPALKMVNLSNNFFYSMPEKPWSFIWRQLTHLDVTGNFIECNCELMWLLPILSPPKLNVTTTPAPTPLPGQIVRGVCSKTLQPLLFATKYELVTLTRDRLNC